MKVRWRVSCSSSLIPDTHKLVFNSLQSADFEITPACDLAHGLERRAKIKLDRRLGWEERPSCESWQYRNKNAVSYCSAYRLEGWHVRWTINRMLCQWPLHMSPVTSTFFRRTAKKLSGCGKTPRFVCKPMK